MQKKINLEEILNNTKDLHNIGEVWRLSKPIILEAMKEACRQSLELAAENAEWEYVGEKFQIPKDTEYVGGSEYGYNYIDKQSILNVINLIE